MGEPRPLPCPCCAKELIERKVLDGQFNECSIWEHPDDNCALAYITIDRFTLPSWNRRAPWTVTRERAEEAYGLMRQAMRRDHLQGKAQHVIEPFIAALGGKVEG